MSKKKIILQGLIAAVLLIVLSVSGLTRTTELFTTGSAYTGTHNSRTTNLTPAESSTDVICILKNFRAKVRYINGDCNFYTSFYPVTISAPYNTEVRNNIFSCSFISSASDYSYSLRGPPVVA